MLVGTTDEIDQHLPDTIISIHRTQNKKELAKLILNLINTRNATLDQIKIMADYYDVNLEEIMDSLGEMNNKKIVKEDISLEEK